MNDTERTYTIREAFDYMEAQGYDYGFRTVQRMATLRALPFHRSVYGHALIIEESALKQALQNLPKNGVRMPNRRVGVGLRR